MNSHCDRSSPSISIGVSYLKELQDATSWGAQHMLRGGDRLHVLHAKEAAVSVDDATHQMTIMAGLREQVRSLRGVPPLASLVSLNQTPRCSVFLLVRRLKRMG
jgi:hypothetical protein